MIGILHHPKIANSVPLASEIATWLEARGQTSWLGSVWALEAAVPQLEQSTLLIVLGGDGSILRAAHFATTQNVPIFSINLGKLGFLSESTLDNWAEKLSQWLEGRTRHERRMLLETEIWREGELVTRHRALNELVISRGGLARPIRIEMEIDDQKVAYYRADGLVVTTATGSTAYSLALGGAILTPELTHLMVVPIAPYLSLDRPILLHDSGELGLTVRFDHEATLTTDGFQTGVLQTGDRVLARGSADFCHFVRSQPSSYFYGRLQMIRNYATQTD